VDTARSLLSAFVSVKLPVEIMKDQTKEILDEYLQEADLTEAQECLQAVVLPHYGHTLVIQVVTLALNMKNRERELASTLLATCHRSGLLSEEQIEDGFVRLIWRLNDLVLDTPESPALLAQFVVRGIADGVLDVGFLKHGGVPDSLVQEGSLGGEFATKLQLYQSKSHMHSKNPANIWGAGKSVDELKVAVRGILDDFFASGDVDEALAGVKELEAPFFLHEMVSKAIIISLDHGTQGQLKAQLLLATAAEQTGLVTPTQVVQGIERVLDSLEETVKDVPNAPTLVARFLFQAFEDGWASRDLLEQRKGGPWGEAFSHGDVKPAKRAAYTELARLESL